MTTRRASGIAAARCSPLQSGTKRSPARCNTSVGSRYDGSTDWHRCRLELKVCQCGTGRGRHPLESRLPGARPVGLPVPPQRRSEMLQGITSTPTCFDDLRRSSDHRLDLVTAREVGAARDLSGVAGTQNQLSDPLGILRSEDSGHRPALRVAEQRRFSTPAASSTARMSSMRSSNDIVPRTRSDIPVPRLSKRISRVNDASAS